MKNMNLAIMTGYLTDDAVVRYTKSVKDSRGNAVPILNFRIAVNSGDAEKDENGKYVNGHAQFFTCTIGGPRGKALQPYLKVGQKVTVYGPIAMKSYTKKDGSIAPYMRITVNELEFQGANRSKQAEPEVLDDDDIPENLIGEPEETAVVTAPEIDQPDSDLPW